MAAINPILRLYEDTYNDEGYASVTHLAKGLLTSGTTLSPFVTHLYYNDKDYGRQNFPVSFLTEGMGNFRSIDSEDLSYKTAIIGKPKKTSTVASTIYTASDNIGLGGTTFVIPFVDRMFSKNQTIQSKDRDVQCHVKLNPEKKSDGFWHYTVELITESKANTCPLELVTAGAKWGAGIHKVGIEDSVGVEHRSYAPGKMMNQISLVRDTYKIKGNVENKIMVMEIKTDRGVKKYWCEWELYLKGLLWKEKCENDLWYSRYNRDSLGEVLNLDLDSNATMPSGAGLIQQIPNETTYSFMTTNKFTQIVRDAFFGASSAGKRKIVLFTGTGGMEEAHNAMKAEAQNYTLVDSRVVKGDKDLTFGAYFRKFRHIDGHEIEMRYLPVLDDGIQADISDKHPVTNLPLESYSMYFVDMSEYDGEANVMYINEKGRENREFIVAGASVPKGYGDTPFRATSRDGSSVEWMKTQGVAIRRPTNCFKVFCTLS